MTTTPCLTPTEPTDLHALERDAAASLAKTLTAALHLPGARDEHRRQLGRVIALAQDILRRAGKRGGEAATMASARFSLVKALAARAQDARHGAGQLSLGSQRAPTRDDCDDGWQRVEELVTVAEESALEATRHSKALNTQAGWEAARAAEAAARDSRRIVDERNRAYTFHADPSFSFGEGWYLAAAAALDGVAVQIEPDMPQTAQAERFLRDAGLGHRIVPYRSRPRANKHLPEIVAHAFSAAPMAVQRKLRAAFLGDATIDQTIVQWTKGTFAGAPNRKKVLLWLRDSAHQPTRNTIHSELVELTHAVLAHGLVPILIGDALQGGEAPQGTVDMTLFWKLPIFQGLDMRRAQLQLFGHLKDNYGLVGQVGVTTGGMDGPALMGLPTMYVTQEPNVRLGRWVGAVPGYQEVVRDDTYLARIGQTLKQWADEG